MKLSELKPNWVCYNNQGPVSGGTVLFGISFLCPHCRNVRINVTFDKPIVPDEWIKHLIDTYGPKAAVVGPLIGMNDGRTWARSGSTFDDLTLSPSIDVSAHGHWHGFITNGEIK